MKKPKLKKETIQITKNKEIEQESVLAFVPLIFFFIIFFALYFLIQIYQTNFRL